MSEATPMGEVLAAVAAAAGEMQKVGKDGKNEHDRYDFASIDSFLSLVRPILSKHGIIVTMDETSIEDFTRKGKYQENDWMRMRWQFIVWHSSGQHLPPSFRTVEVLRNGAQAYGSGQSYALKQFLRALFQISTGDKDDADIEVKQDGLAGNGMLTEEQIAELDALIEETQSDPEAFAKAVKAADIASIPAATFERAKGMLLKKRERMAKEKEEPASE